MKMIYMGKYTPSLDKIFDGFFETETEALKYIRHIYKAGTNKFYIDTDTDGILMELKTLHDSGKMKHLKLKVHKRYGSYDFINQNKDWIEPYYE